MSRHSSRPPRLISLFSSCVHLLVRTGYVKLRFNPSGVQDSEARLLFHIFTNTTSQEPEPQETITMVALVVKRAEVSIKG